MLVFTLILTFGCSSIESDSCERRKECELLPPDKSADQCTQELEAKFDSMLEGDRADCEKLHEECLDFEGCVAISHCFRRIIIQHCI